MRIGIVSSSTSELGDSIRVHKFGEVLRKIGFEVKVYHPLCKIEPSTRGRFSSSLRAAPTFFSRGLKSFLRDYNIHLVSRALYKMAKKDKLDILQAETHVSAMIAARIKTKLNIPLFFDIHGLSVQEHEKIHSSSKRYVEYLRDMEKICIEQSDQIFVVSNYMKEYFEQLYPELAVRIVPNGADIHENLDKHYEHPLKVVYAGIFAYWERVGDYLDSISYVDKSSFDFYLAGDGYQRGDILEKIRDQRVPVKYLGYLPRKKLIDLLRDMHVGIAPSSTDIVRKVASPIKVFEYLSMGLPVITADVGEWSELIRRKDCGEVVPPENSKKIAEALEMYSSDRKKWKKHSENGIRLIKEEYNWEKIIGKVRHVYKNY
jgi:glycosyltransferase involved in cell wall biosynthesis